MVNGSFINIIRNPLFEDGLSEWQFSPGVAVHGPVTDPLVEGNYIDLPGGCFLRQEYDPPPVLGGTHRLGIWLNSLKSGRFWMHIRFSYEGVSDTEIQYPDELPSSIVTDKPGWNLLALEAKEDERLTSLQINNMNTHEHATIGIANLILAVPTE